MKSYEKIAAQCERIMAMYLKGYGTQKMIEKVERIFFKVYATSY
jgi:hypothetical protein